MPGLDAKCQCSSQVPEVLPDVARMWLPLCRECSGGDLWLTLFVHGLHSCLLCLETPLLIHRPPGLNCSRGEKHDFLGCLWMRLYQNVRGLGGHLLPAIPIPLQLKHSFYLQLCDPSLAGFPSSPSTLSRHFTIGREERQGPLVFCVVHLCIVNRSCGIMTYQANIRDK